MNNETYLEKHQAEVFKRIAEGLCPLIEDKFSSIFVSCATGDFNPLTNKAQTYDLLMWYWRWLDANCYKTCVLTCRCGNHIKRAMESPTHTVFAVMKAMNINFENRGYV